MAYTNTNFKTKKALIETFANGAKISTHQPGGYFPSKTDGRISLEGPHYPAPHAWYASATITDGCIVTFEGKTAEQYAAKLLKLNAKKAK